MAKYKIADIAVEVNERENNPSCSKYDRFVGLEHYVSGKVIIRNYGSTERLESTMKVFQSGDIIVARRNVYLKRAATVGFDGLTSGDSIVLRAKNPIIGRVLPFVLNTDEFWDFADQYSDGTMSKRLSPKTLMQYEFTLPPEEELEHFADLLWAANDTREAYSALLKQTDELVKSQFIEMFGEPLLNPKGYPVCRLPDIAQYWNGLTYKPSDVAETGTIVLRSSNIQNGKLAFDDVVRVKGEIREKAYVNEADILMCSRNGSATLVGKVALISGISEPMAFGAFMMIIRSPYYPYLLQFFQTDAFRSQVVTGTTTINQITGKMLDQVRLPVPPMDQVKQFEMLLRQSDKSKFELKKAIENTSALIKSLMQKGLS